MDLKEKGKKTQPPRKVDGSTTRPAGVGLCQFSIPFPFRVLSLCVATFQLFPHQSTEIILDLGQFSEMEYPKSNRKSMRWLLKKGWVGARE